MPTNIKYSNILDKRVQGDNTIFLNNFNNSDFDFNMVKSSYISGNLILDNTKTISGYTTTKLERAIGIFRFQENYSQWTIEYWVYPTSYSGSYLWFYLANSSGSGLLALNQSGANVYTEWTGTGGGYVFDNPSNNTAHHVAVTYDNGSIKLYWNGVLKNTFSSSFNSSGCLLYFNNAQATSTNIFRLRVSKNLRYTSNFTPQTTLLSVD